MDLDKLHTLKKLAAELGVGYSFTRALAKAGMPTPGGKTSVREAQRWMKANPDFRVSDYFPRRQDAEPVAA